MNNFDFDVNRDIARFLSFQQSLGYKTISYEDILYSFRDYIEEAYPFEKNLTNEMIIGYLEEQNRAIHNKATVLRLFGKYLKATGQDAYELPKNMYSNPKADVPYIFTDQELHKLFIEIDRFKSPDDDWISSVAPVLFRLIYTCGLRPKEGRELERRFINFETGEIFIKQSKKKKDRTVVMSEDMLNLCRLYDEKRSDLGIKSKYFFCNLKGIPYQRKYIYTVFIGCCKKAINNARLNSIRVYCLRHRFATAVIHRWLDEKKDLRNKLPYLQMYMGHDYIEDTIYYVHRVCESFSVNKIS